MRLVKLRSPRTIATSSRCSAASGTRGGALVRGGGAGNASRVGAGNPLTVGGTTPDNVWIFNPDVDGTYTVTVYPDEPWDAILYIAQTYCSPPTAGNCVGFSNKTGPGGTEYLVFPALSDRSYFIAVDGLDAPNGSWAKAGGYRISLTGP